MGRVSVLVDQYKISVAIGTSFQPEYNFSTDEPRGPNSHSTKKSMSRSTAEPSVPMASTDLPHSGHSPQDSIRRSEAVGFAVVS